MIRIMSLLLLLSSSARGQFDATFDLTTMDGMNGFRLLGQEALDYAGTSVSSAGDINHDGLEDLLISAIGTDTNNTSSGTVYVLFGRAGGFPANLQLAGLDGSNGFAVHGESPFDHAGVSASGVGDVNQDGIDDIIIPVIGEDLAGNDSGAVYVLFGQSSGTFQAAYNVSELTGSVGSVILSEGAFGEAGYSAAGLGDFNGDQINDIVIGAHYLSVRGPDAGAAYVVFGGATLNQDFNVADINGQNGIKIYGLSQDDELGSSVSPAGDLNGDGLNDLVVGAPGVSDYGYRSGAAYVLFGDDQFSTAEVDLNTLDGSNGFVVTSDLSGQYLGGRVNTAGDINHDGLEDLVISGSHHLPDQSGQAVLIYGRADAYPANTLLSEINGTNGFTINAGSLLNNLGTAIGSAGDFNGDGLNDLFVGAFNSDTAGDNAGSLYVIYGRNEGFGAAVDVSRLGQTTGLVINGPEAGGTLGNDASLLNDFNQDGLHDLMIGSSLATGNATRSGVGYVVYGRTLAVATDLSLSVTSEAFGDGIVPGESGFIDFHVTNLGPLPITDPDYQISVTHGHNLTQDLFLYDEFQSAEPLGDGCVFIANNSSPPLPEGDFRFWQAHSYIGPLAVGETITCQIPVTFPRSGYLETLWRLGPAITDPDLSNNEVPFIFRGQTFAVPLDAVWLLPMGLLMLGVAVAYRRRLMTV